MTKYLFALQHGWLFSSLAKLWLLVLCNNRFCALKILEDITACFEHVVSDQENSYIWVQRLKWLSLYDLLFVSKFILASVC